MAVVQAGVCRSTTVSFPRGTAVPAYREVVSRWGSQCGSDGDEY